MKHLFLLDENILYFAIKGVDKHDNVDSTAMELIDLIAVNCHSITINQALLDRYWHHLKILRSARSPVMQPIFFITQFIKNSAKAGIDYSAPLELPVGAEIPPKDIHVVRAALVAHPLIVTSDEDLWKAINRQPAPQLKALTPTEAIAFAKEQ